jgi:hypothetical protein
VHPPPLTGGDEGTMRSLRGRLAIPQQQRREGADDRCNLIGGRAASTTVHSIFYFPPKTALAGDLFLRYSRYICESVPNHFNTRFHLYAPHSELERLLSFQPNPGLKSWTDHRQNHGLSLPAHTDHSLHNSFRLAATNHSSGVNLPKRV